MRSFGSPITVIVTIGFFAITILSAPAPWNPWNHPSWSGTAPWLRPVAAAAPPPATTTVASSSNSGNNGVSTGSGSGSGSGSSSGGSGTPGYATIVNKCSFPTYVSVCKQHPASCGGTATMAANTGTYSEAYAPMGDAGHSLKISVTEGAGDILQFEYTNEGNGYVSYDLSEVNGNPFGTWGFSLMNTTADAFCAPPATDCSAIFTNPTNGVPYTAPTSDGIGAILCG
ncbi:MAG: hypothetical protein Q9175_004703 [Cornicularia normoerica]